MIDNDKKKAIVLKRHSCFRTKHLSVSSALAIVVKFLAGSSPEKLHFSTVALDCNILKELICKKGQFDIKTFWFYILVRNALVYRHRAFTRIYLNKKSDDSIDVVKSPSDINSSVFTSAGVIGMLIDPIFSFRLSKRIENTTQVFILKTVGCYTINEKKKPVKCEFDSRC